MKWNNLFNLNVANIVLLFVLLITFIFPDFFYEKKVFAIWAGGFIIYYLYSILNNTTDLSI